LTDARRGGGPCHGIAEVRGELGLVALRPVLQRCELRLEGARGWSTMRVDRLTVGRGREVGLQRGDGLLRSLLRRGLLLQVGLRAGYCQ
jgi:hypothetical protein